MSIDVAGTASFAVGAAVVTFFAPCSYALLPGYVAYYVATVDAERAPLAGALFRGVAATAGVFVTFGVLSAIAIGAGAALERLLPLIEPVVGVSLLVIGGYVLYTGTLSVHVVLPERRSSILGFALFGAAYAVAATACVLPLFLAIVLESLTLSTGAAVSVLAAYTATFGMLMLGVTVMTAVGQGLSAGRLAKYNAVGMRIAGAVLVLAGAGQLYVAATYTY